MNKNKIPLTIGLALKAVPPEAVDAGAEFSFSVLANWPEGIAAKDASYVIRDGERILASGNLPEPGGNGIALKVVAPEEAGEHRLRFVVESGDAKGSLEFALKVVPHETSLAAWDIPSPVVRGALFAVKGENGAVRLRVPKGEFPLVVTRAGYEMPERNLAVAKDVRVRVAAEALPEEDPFAMWTA